MMLLALALLQAGMGPTFAEVKTLAPEAAGTAILGDRPHGVVEIVELATDGMLPPGIVEAELIERATMRDTLCVRQGWRVKFRAGPGSAVDTGTVDDIFGFQEIALPRHDGCPPGRYAYLNPGIDPARGRAVLDALERAIAAHSRVALRCEDTVGSGLCRGAQAVRATLRSLRPWVITTEDGDTAVWLRTPGKRFSTEVRFPTNRPGEALVTRSYPAPF